MPSCLRASCSDIWKSRYPPVLHESGYGETRMPCKKILTFSIALIGTVEELAASQQTLNLVRDQFEINYFGPLNIIKAALPHMRREQSGHIMIISGISMISSTLYWEGPSNQYQRRTSAPQDWACTAQQVGLSKGSAT